MHLKPLALTSLVFALSLPAHSANTADPASLEALQAQINALSARVQKLENEVEEGVAVNRAKKVEAQPGGAGNPKNWKLLYEGMESYRVAEILGEPKDTKAIRKHELWYYDQGKLTFYLGRLKSVDQ